MRRSKVLVAGVVAFAVVISTATVPVSAGAFSGKMIENRRVLADKADMEFVLPVEGMSSEWLEVFNQTTVPEDTYDQDVPVENGQIVIGPDENGHFLKNGGVYYIWPSWDNNKYIGAKTTLSVNDKNERKDAIGFQLIDGKFIEYDKEKKMSLGNEIKKIVVHLKSYESVELPEFDVVYSDGSKVEDGVTIDIMPDKGENDVRSGTPKVKDGKITPNMTINANTMCSIGFAKDSSNSKLFKVVGADESNDFINVFVDEGGNAYVMKGVYNYEDKSIPFSKITLEKKAGDPLVVPAGPQDPTIENITDDETALGAASGVAVKGKRIAPGKDVKVSDIEVVFEDGTKVPDGVTIDNFLVSDINAKPAHYMVNNGKISGIVLKADKQYKLGFDATNADYNNYEIVGADNSKKFLDVYARYEGGVLLKFDNVKGVEAPEKEISRLVIKKTDVKPSEQKKI